MNRHTAGMLFSALFLSQQGFSQEAGPGIIRGTVVQADAGMLDIRQTSGSLARCSFDSRTWIERERKRMPIDALEPGTPVEALTDIRMGRCYTRTVRLVTAATAASPLKRPVMPTRSAIDSIYPRGNVTFAGVVLRRSPTALVLRTRTEPEKIVRLREDTRYLASGSPATLAEIEVNTRVFVRGGKNFENDFEAFQIVWGEIDGPKSISTN